MTNSSRLTSRLLEGLAPFIGRGTRSVDRPTPVPRLTVWISARDTQPTLAVFEPMLYAVLRGAKVLIMGANRFELLPGACAVSSFGLPYSHQLTGATYDLPYVGVSLHLDTGLLTQVMHDMPRQDDRWTCAVAAGDLDGSVGETFARLVELVNKPDDIDMLAPHYEAELYYRLLQSPMGDTLRQIGQRNPRFKQLKTAADWLAAKIGRAHV